MLKRLDVRGVPAEELRHRLPKPIVAGDEPIAAVREILAAVEARGDAAVREYTERFDRVQLDELRVPPAALQAALERIDPTVRSALEAAAEEIEAFQRSTLTAPHTHQADGVVIRSWRQPVARAGCYVPGGRAIYPSTVLMTAIPAKVAGVAEVALCVPPERGTGTVPAVTLAAAAVAGVDEVYAIGGAQAIGALAFGTETIRPVDVIVGPGNVYVAVAKREVAGRGLVAIPSAFAGPSEVVVVADETVAAEFAAIDVIVQAEHGPDGLAWLVCWSDAVADSVSAAIEALVDRAPRKAEILSTLDLNGYAVVCDDAAQAIEVANVIAPEHLELLCDAAVAEVGRVRNAGAVFLGPHSPASVGDYAAGPSHTLPTYGSARFSSVLSVDDFTKHMHTVEVQPAGFERLAPHVVALARAEGFDAHASSITLRQAAR
ncbi:MAG: histidinol dehydrogenase [Acidimicrobiales bacterium]|nr:histidinol dehydrogenase [Acidimicrobiales bacterium]